MKDQAPACVIISFSNLLTDPRVKRQMAALAGHYRIFTIGYGARPELSARHLQLEKPSGIKEKIWFFLLLQLRLYRFAFNCYAHLNVSLNFILAASPGLVVLNDAVSWPWISNLPPDICFLDAHEYSPLEMQHDWIWRLFVKPFKLWCSRFGVLAAQVSSVEPTLCRRWQSFLGRPILLIRNIAAKPEAAHVPLPRPIAQTASCASKPLRLLHHGGVNQSRRLDLMMHAVAMAAPDVVCDFVLVGLKNDSHGRLLNRLARTLPGVRLLPPVSSDQLIELGRHYDLGFISVYPSNFNNQYCMPNKFFEFIHSGLPVVVGPTPGMADLVKHYGCGVVAEGFKPEQLATALKAIDRRSLQQWNSGVQKAAQELCWQQEKKVLLDAAFSILSPSLSPSDFG